MESLGRQGDGKKSMNHVLKCGAFTSRDMIWKSANEDVSVSGFSENFEAVFLIMNVYSEIEEVDAGSVNF